MANHLLVSVRGPAEVLRPLGKVEFEMFGPGSQVWCFDPAFIEESSTLAFRSKSVPPLDEVIGLAYRNIGQSFRLQWSDPLGSTAGRMDIRFLSDDDEDWRWRCPVWGVVEELDLEIAKQIACYKVEATYEGCSYRYYDYQGSIDALESVREGVRSMYKLNVFDGEMVNAVRRKLEKETSSKFAQRLIGEHTIAKFDEMCLEWRTLQSFDGPTSGVDG